VEEVTKEESKSRSKDRMRKLNGSGKAGFKAESCQTKKTHLILITTNKTKGTNLRPFDTQTREKTKQNKHSKKLVSDIGYHNGLSGKVERGERLICTYSA